MNVGQLVDMGANLLYNSFVDFLRFFDLPFDCFVDGGVDFNRFKYYVINDC